MTCVVSHKGQSGHGDLDLKMHMQGVAYDRLPPLKISRTVEITRRD